MRVIGTTMVGGYSGADEAIFENMRSRNHFVEVLDGYLPASWRAFFLAKSFHPSKSRWYHDWQHQMIKTPLAFGIRTRSLNRRIRARVQDYDAILHMGALFAPFCGEYPVPVTLFCDYTTKLAEANYAAWFGLRGPKADSWYRMETDLYQNCAMIFTASENTRTSLIEHYHVDPMRAQTVGEGVDAVYECAGKRYDESTVLFIGTDFDRKGGPTLLKAFAVVRARLPKARLLIAGPRPRPTQKGVEWIGHIDDRKRLQQLFSEATVFAMPSVCEPFGLVLIEAMSHGLPVIGSTADAMAEIISDGETGYVVPIGDHEALADRLTHLLSAPDRCAQLGRNGRLKVKDQFLWSQVVERIEAGLKAVTATV